MKKFIYVFFLLFLLHPLIAAPLLIGYYSNQAQYRPGAAACLPEHLGPVVRELDVLNYSYLHVNYQSAVKPAGPTNDWQIHFAEWNDEEYLKELRQRYPSLKIFVSLQHLVLPHEEACQAFAQSALSFTEKWQLQGLDIAGHALLPVLKALKVKSSSLMISVAIHDASAEELLELSPFVDWFNIQNTSQAEKLIESYIKAGVPAEKLALTVSCMGHCSSEISGYYTKKPGNLAYFEIIDGLDKGLFAASQITFATPEKALEKGRWALKNHLKGAVIMNLDSDNFMDPLLPFALTFSLKEGLTS